MAASRRPGLRRAAEGLPGTRRVVHRFVPGETTGSALDSVAALRMSGRYVSVDYLGEDVSNADDAHAAVQTYLDLIEKLGQYGDPAGPGVRPLEVSVKLSALGQSLQHDGDKIARENAWAICDAAGRL
jgi:proline dehydrogenase